MDPVGPVAPRRAKYGHDRAATAATPAAQSGTALRAEASAVGVPGGAVDATVRTETMIAPG